MSDQLSSLYHRKFGRRMAGAQHEAQEQAHDEKLAEWVEETKVRIGSLDPTQAPPMPTVDLLRDTIQKSLGKRAEYDEWAEMIEATAEEAKNANEYGAIHVSDPRGAQHGWRLQYYRCIKALESVYYRSAAAIQRRGHSVKGRIVASARRRLGW